MKRLYKIEVYDYKLHVIVSEDIPVSRVKLSKEIGRDFKDIGSVSGLHSIADNDRLESFLFLSPDSSNGTVAHESLHATIRILNLMGVELSDSSEEAFTYLLGYIVDKCHLTIKEYNLK